MVKMKKKKYILIITLLILTILAILSFIVYSYQLRIKVNKLDNSIQNILENRYIKIGRKSKDSFAKIYYVLSYGIHGINENEYDYFYKIDILAVLVKKLQKYIMLGGDNNIFTNYIYIGEGGYIQNKDYNSINSCIRTEDGYIKNCNIGLYCINKKYKTHISISIFNTYKVNDNQFIVIYQNKYDEIIELAKDIDKIINEI